MESLPRDILKEIAKRLSLSCNARLAQTCKSFNRSIWSLVTTLDEDDTDRIQESTGLDRFNNLESLLFRYYATVIPQDLRKLTSLQKLQIIVDNTSKMKLWIESLRNLTNLRELDVTYKCRVNVQLDDVLANHTRLTKLDISAYNLEQSDLFHWKIMTRLRHLALSTNFDPENPKFPNGFFSRLWTLTQLRGLGLTSMVLDQLEPEPGLSKLINLEVLEMYDCKLRDDDNGEWMLDYNELLDLKKLTNLSLMDVSLDEKLTDVIANTTQLVDLNLYDYGNEYKLSTFSKMKNLTQLWLSLNILESDLGLDFTQMPKLEVVSVPLYPNVTQLVHLKKLRQLYLRQGSRNRPQNDSQTLNFLNELVTLKDLNIYATLLPSDGVDMKGMTSLMDVTITMYSQIDNVVLQKFVQSLSAVPSLVSLDIGGNINQEVLQTIATSLTQLRVLKLPKKGRSLFKDDTTKDSARPSLSEFGFKVEFSRY